MTNGQMDGRIERQKDGRTERQKLSPSAFLQKGGGQQNCQRNITFSKTYNHGIYMNYFPNVFIYKVYRMPGGLNLYTPSVLLVGHRQTVQNQIIHHKTQRLIRISTVCLQKIL